MGDRDSSADYNAKITSEIEARIEAERRMLARRRRELEDCARIAATVLRIEERRFGKAVGYRVDGKGKGIKRRHRGPP